MRDMLLRLADELESMDVREGCRTCPADGTKDCRGDVSCEEAVARAAARRIREIVERDECEVTTMSAYDLLPDDDREAIAWVRERGGLDEVRRRWKCLSHYADPVPRSCMEKRLARLQRQIDESHAALRRRNRWIAELEHLLCKEMSYSLRRDAGCLAPEALDADGVPIREGDTVYVLDFGEPLTVKGFMDDGRVLMSFHDENSLGYKPSKLTHEQPDTWERIEEDARLQPTEYTDRYRVGRFGFESEDMRADLVRRCRALAERGE